MKCFDSSEMYERVLGDITEECKTRWVLNCNGYNCSDEIVVTSKNIIGVDAIVAMASAMGWEMKKVLTDLGDEAVSKERYCPKCLTNQKYGGQHGKE
jgi:hypothetical protein